MTDLEGQIIVISLLFLLQLAITLSVLNRLSPDLCTTMYGTRHKKDLIELDIDLNLTLTLHIKLLNFATTCHICVIHVWI
jgi:hypothetical protein